jgi:hypothetical protein
MTAPITAADVEDEITEVLVTVDEWRLLSEGRSTPVLTSSPPPDPSRRSSALASLLVRGLAVQDQDGSVALHPLTGWVSTVSTSATSVIDLARAVDGEPQVIQLVDSASGRFAASPVGLELVRVTALGQDQALAEQAAVLCERVWSEEPEVQLYVRVWTTTGQSFFALLRDEDGWKQGVQGAPPIRCEDPSEALGNFLRSALGS